MDPNDVTVGLNFIHEHRGGTAAAGRTIELRITRHGCYETGGVGGAGQAVDPLTFEIIAATLTSHFEREALLLVLEQLVRLRDAVENVRD